MLYPYEYYKNGTEFPSGDLPESMGNSGKAGPRAFEIRCCSLHRQWMIWRIVSGVMGLFFFVAAWVQHNDPDPYLWMPVYMIPCIISWAVAFGLTLKAYKSLPSENSSRSGTPTPEKLTGKGLAEDRGGSVKMDATVIIPKYGNANKKLDWIITCHVVFCFALGIYTLGVHLAGIRVGFESSDMQLYRRQEDFGDESRGGRGNGTRMTSMTSSVEEAKELMGLCLVIAWLSLLRHSNYVLLGRTGLSLGIAMTIIPVLAWVAVEVFEDDSDYQKC